MPFKPERLIETRKRRGYTQVYLAKAVGVSERTIRDWEHSTGEPTGEHLLILAHYLDINPDYLLGLSDDPSPAIVLDDLEYRLILAIRAEDWDEVSTLVLRKRKAKNSTKKGGLLGSDPRPS